MLRIRKVMVVLVLSSALPALAQPPSHAPAHGWRKKHDPDYMGYTGTRWQDDYGIASGRCNREALGGVVGGVLGGVLGSVISQGDSGTSRAVAIIAGSAIGAFLGRRIGREFDDADRACMGHALELGKPGQRVRWESAGVNYTLQPGVAAGTRCRNFTLTASSEGRSQTREGVACRQGDGEWRLRD